MTNPASEKTEASKLFQAVYDYDVKEVEALLQGGADPDEGFEEMSPLIYAANMGYTEIMNLLIAYNADVNKYDGTTALIQAAQGRIDVVRLLLAHDAKVDVTDTEGWTALKWAVSSGDIDIVRLLVDHGADVSICDNAGESPLTIAEGGNHEIVVLLKQITETHKRRQISHAAASQSQLLAVAKAPAYMIRRRPQP